MSRISVVTFVATLAVGMFLVVGCRAHHLGDSHGKAYFGAIQSQAAGDGSVAPEAMTADDAKRVMRVHATGEDKAGDKRGATGSPTAPPSTSSSSGSMSGGQWPGATGNISLEAK